MLRVSAFQLSRFIAHQPKRVSKSIRGWIELIIDELPDIPEDGRAPDPEKWKTLPAVCSQFLLAPPPEKALGPWLAGMISEWQPHNVFFAGVHLSIRLGKALLLRLELPARPSRDVSVRLFGPGNKPARRMTITFEDGTMQRIDLDSEDTQEPVVIRSRRIKRRRRARLQKHVAQ